MEAGKKVSELQLAMSVAGGIIVLFGFSFGVFWKIISDVKHSAHERMDRLEKELHDQKKHCDDCRSTFVPLVHFERIERGIDDIKKDVTQALSAMNKRIDDLILSINNNGKRHE